MHLPPSSKAATVKPPKPTPTSAKVKRAPPRLIGGSLAETWPAMGTQPWALPLSKVKASSW
eukprot:5196913-Alexandrium_andersonii.AAC.1